MISNAHTIFAFKNPKVQELRHTAAKLTVL